MRLGIISGFLAAATLLAACAQVSEKPTDVGRRALIIVDMQYDFLPGGSLPTPGGDEIVSLINELQPHFDLIVATQDWHPKKHGSFASQHAGTRAGERIDLNGLDQVQWPDHAVQNTHGAELVADLNQSRIARVFQKGVNPEVDSYSGFFDNGQRGDTGLNDYLKEQSVSEVYVVGLALDYCVKYTALDAQRIGFKTALIVDASRAVNLQPTDGKEAVEAMEANGVEIIKANHVLTRTD